MVIVLEFLWAVMSVIILLGVLLEVVMPLWKGTKVFPSFRRNRRVIADELASVREQYELEKLAKELEAEREWLRKIRGQTENSSEEPNATNNQ